jgi:hypothetical protein
MGNDPDNQPRSASAGTESVIETPQRRRQYQVLRHYQKGGQCANFPSDAVAIAGNTWRIVPGHLSV